MKKLASLLVLALALVGCRDVKIVNGEVPSEYLGQAKKLEGIYHGQFNGVGGDLTISFEGNKPVVSFNGENGNDILAPKCQSRIGLLKSVSLGGSKENPEVKSATFAFSPNNCLSVEGRELILAAKEKNGAIRITATILREVRTERECRWEYIGNPQNGGGMHEVCNIRQTPYYFSGRFER